MYLLHRKKIDIYANISLFLSYSEVTAFTRSDGGSAPRDDLYYSPERQRTRTPRWAPETDPQWGPRHLDGHQEKTSGTSWAIQSDFAAVGMNCCVVWPEEKWPPDWAWFLPRFFSLSPMEFWFLAAVASGLLSWGHFISSFVDLIEQKLFELNWAGRCHHWIQQWNAFNWKLSV